jgi:hypothetical protein
MFLHPIQANQVQVQLHWGFVLRLSRLDSILVFASAIYASHLVGDPWKLNPGSKSAYQSYRLMETLKRAIGFWVRRLYVVKAQLLTG